MCDVKKLLIFLFCLTFTTFVYSQKQGNIWYFADGLGLDFNNDPPLVLSDGQIFDILPGQEGCSTISDSSGSLLFYSSGEKVWNKDHQIMPNGDSLMGGISSVNAAFILPKPGSSTIFYLFTTDAFYPNDLINGLRYSVVDMCEENGLGDILPGSKNTLLLDTSGEKLTAAKHSNGIDYWLIAHKYWSDAFYSFLLTSNGIENPVVSNVGSVHEVNGNPSSTAAAFGQMKASPDGTKIALVFSNTTPSVAELFDFNSSTGVVSNPISLPTDMFEYGVSFSPDNTKLYISTTIIIMLYQYNLLAWGGQTDSIINSKVLISNPPQQVTGLQIGPDDKIYISGPNRKYIAVINNPNEYGLACNFIDSAIYLNGISTRYSLPGFIDNYDYHNGLVDCSTGIDNKQGEGNALNIYPNPFNEKTTFTYNIDEPGYVELIIHSYDGKHIATLLSEQKDEGSYSVNWNTTDIAPGVYFYSLKVDGDEWVKKAIKIK